MQKKRLIPAVMVMFLFLVINGVLPVLAQNTLIYSSEVTPTPFQYRRLEWRVTNVTSEAVEWGWGTGDFWVAKAGSRVTFEIYEIHDNEVHGLFAIGNLTLPTNDSRIATELVLSIWSLEFPWFPGLISPLNWDEVDQNAINSVTGFMEGDLEIRTQVSTKAYIYQQGVFGNQNTTLVYSLRTGILQEAYTEIFFAKDYHLGLKLVQAIMIPTPLTLLLSGGMAIVVSSLAYICYIRLRRKG